MLSVLAGHKHYSHVTTIRCDGVNPSLAKIISEDALRNALKHLPEAEGCGWMDICPPAFPGCWTPPRSSTPTPPSSHQEGAVVSYGPKKPGCPSHRYHTDLMAGTREILGVEVQAGNEQAAKPTQPGLLNILDDLPPEKKPKWVRDDSAFSNDALMSTLEVRKPPYLFKLKLTKNVKRHIGRLFNQSGWTDAEQGWEGKDGELALTGWEAKRRVVVLRRPLIGEVMMDSHSWPSSRQIARSASKSLAMNRPCW